MTVCAILRCWLVRCGVLFALLGAAGPLTASDITISRASVKVTNGIVILDADAGLEFSDDAIDALHSGIPLIFELDIRISRPRRFLWDPEVFATRWRFSLQRHALSDQYILNNLITGDRRIHGSLELAIDDLGRVRNLALVEHDELGVVTPLTYSIRLRLDIESLPAPMIPLAYITPGWRMSSGWHRWQAAP